MGKDILFRWEDCDALKHHCGFCNRPLSHPQAKTSCFGPHAEPCFRFHQVMFMRNRGHTCDMCMHIDEHHYKRHREMCELIRSIYESCDEEWPLIPDDDEPRGRSATRGSDAFDSDDRSSTSGDLPLKKRDRKEQKRQIRAASRTKVVTQEDISYIDSVLHPTAIEMGPETPANPEEIEEIEQHLKYNAQCYNHGQKRSDIRQFARIPDADIDFGAEIDRIFEILRIAELLKRNERNRGLRNKELAYFKTLISELKDHIITDLVQAKKDDLEIRMRRAAFLRYTNRASYDIVANRYANKDWKTGEKYRSTGSESACSDSLTAVDEELEGDDRAEQNDLRNLSAATLHDADRRHIEHSHKKLGSDGLLEEVVAVQESKDRPTEATPKPPPSLRIINTNIMPPQKIKFHNPFSRRKSSVTTPLEALKRSAQNLSSSDFISNHSTPDDDDGWQSVGPTTTIPTTPRGRSDTHQSKIMGSVPTPVRATPYATPKAPWNALKPMRVGTNGSMYRYEADRMKAVEKLDRDEKQARLDAQTQIQERRERLEVAEALLQRQLEDRKLKKATGVAELPDVKHAAVESRKKKDKKKQRETERKARRAAEKEPTTSERVDVPPEDVEVGCHNSELWGSDIMFGDGAPDQDARDLGSLSSEGCTMETGDPVLADNVRGGLAVSLRSATKARTKRTDTEFVAKDKVSSDLGLHSVSSTPESPSILLEEAPQLSPKLSKDLSANVHTVGGVASSKHKSVVFSPPKGSAPIPITKFGRHKDWLKFASSIKVDKVSKPLFTSDHPAYKDTVTACWWVGVCPFEASGTGDCPYHKTYCKCVDPTDAVNSQYIVHAESHPCQIGPFNYMQSEKLMQFFESQPETKGRLMLIDEDLYTWVYTVGRHWRIDTITMKKLDNTPMPKRLSWEVEDYMRGFSKGRILKQVDQFQDLADRNERLGAIGCRTKITEQLLESMREKCETASDDEAICYCRDNMPEHPNDDEDLVECMYVDCPVQFFHRRCVEKLGYKKVSTWYCGWCERSMSVAAQKALHGAHSMSVGLPVPDFDSGAYEGPLSFVAQGVDAVLTGHCEKR